MNKEKISTMLSNSVVDWNKTQLKIAMFIFAVLFFVPFFTRREYILHILVVTFIYCLFAQSWNILGGIAGTASIGHIMYFGLGGYLTAFLFVFHGVSPWIGLLLSGVVGILFALFVSFLTLRYGLREDYYALFTLAMSMMLFIIFMNLPGFGGAEGIYIPHRGHNFLMMQFGSRIPWYYIGLISVALLLYFTYRLLKSKIGLYFIAIRENEMAAEASGVDTIKYKRMATVISGALTAMTGAYFVMYTTYAHPDLIFGFSQNFEFLLMAIFGGAGSILGPVLGTMILKPIAEYSRAMLGGLRPGTAYMVYGMILVLSILFLSNGIVGLLKDILYKAGKALKVSENN